MCTCDPRTWEAKAKEDPWGWLASQPSLIGKHQVPVRGRISKKVDGSGGRALELVLCPPRMLTATYTHKEKREERKGKRGKEKEKRKNQTDRQTMVRKVSLRRQHFKCRRQRGETGHWIQDTEKVTWPQQREYWLEVRAGKG